MSLMVFRIPKNNNYLMDTATTMI